MNSILKGRTVCGLGTLLFLAGCGGGGYGGGDGYMAPGPTPPTPVADTTAPIVSAAAANVSANAVTFTATATDNVGVTSVNFIVDDGTIQGSVQKSPTDGSYSLALPLLFITAGDHRVSAIASDAAGNTTMSAVASFTIQSPPGSGTGNDTTPPGVTAAAVEGNFGLVKLTAIVTDNVRVDSVDFLVDGKLTGFRASPAYLSTDPANQYFTRFDTTTLTSGPHILVARATDRAFNTTNSADVMFEVNASAGLIETEPNGTIATANAVGSTQTQIAGNLKTVTQVIGSTQVLTPDIDYYQISIAAGQTVSIDMLSGSGFFLELEDANALALSNVSTKTASDVTNIVYTNDQTPRMAYIRVTSIPYDFMTRDQYKLSLTYR